MRVIADEERRSRLVRRHRLAVDRRAGAADLEQVSESVVCLHATDPATVYLSAWARTDAFSPSPMEDALYRRRSLVKHLAMRRTLFVATRRMLPVIHAGASLRVAGAETRRLIRDVEKAGLFRDGRRWLERARSAALEVLAERELSSTELRAEVPLLEGSVTYGAGRTWEAQVPVGPRVLTILSAEGRIVRASNRGDWTSSRPRWTAMERWLGEPLPELDEDEGRDRLIRAWLASFGPGTVEDLKWWLGSTLTAVRDSLGRLDVSQVGLEGGGTGYVLAEDLEPDPAPVWDSVALLPGLDPTTMGWYQRDWYLGDHRKLLFDTAGNAGPTVWVGGRIVGGWWQAPDGEVVTHLLEDVGAEARTRIDEERLRLSSWLDGRVIMLRFPSPLARTVITR
jgi:hypothetical protein